jgi:hypothetical protein
MRRRALLTTLVAGTSTLAGCVSFGSPATDSETTRATDQQPTADTADAPDEQSADTTAESPVEPSESFSIVDLDTVRRTYALTPTRYYSDDEARVALQFARTGTADHPPAVAVSLTNDNDFENTFRLDWLPPFGRHGSRNPHRLGRPREDYETAYRATLYFVPTDAHPLVDDPPAVEQDADGVWRLADSPNTSEWGPEQYRLAPGETLRGEYALVGHPEGAGTGRPTGVYEFRGGDSGLRLAVWDTDRPGPTTDSRFAGTDLPPIRRTREGESVPTAWFHDADATTPSYVLPETERATLPEGIEFTFVNASRETTRCGHWTLYKLVDGEWFHVAPYVRTADCRLLRPGGTKTWDLHAYPGEAIPSYGDQRTVGYLGGGRYGVVAGYGHATPESGALVELVGPPVELVPTEDVDASRDGTTVTVTAPQYGDAEHPPDAGLVVTRTDVDPERRLIPEQVMRRRYRGLRNTLAFLDSDVERVVLRTTERVVDRTVGYDGDSLTFRLSGSVYDAVREGAIEVDQ